LNRLNKKLSGTQLAITGTACTRSLSTQLPFCIEEIVIGPFYWQVEKAPTELTPEMLATGSWRTTQLRPYNLAALGLEPSAGCLHPLLKVGVIEYSSPAATLQSNQYRPGTIRWRPSFRAKGKGHSVPVEYVWPAAVQPEMPFSLHFFLASVVLNGLVKVHTGTLWGHKERKKCSENLVLTACMGIHKSNFLPAQARCGPDFTSKVRSF
jgi:hypothetical protein